MTLILELPDNREAALKAKARAQGVSAEQYAVQVIDRALGQVNSPDNAGERPIWETITEIMKNVPDEAFDMLPKAAQVSTTTISMARPRKLECLPALPDR